jgi:pimeloyl-ACP methyl ester carboxylesterase
MRASFRSIACDGMRRSGSAWPRKRKELGKVEPHTAEIDGLPVRWLQAPCPDPPILWLHGVPDSAELWTPFLARAGGIAVDLPGFGASGKPADWPYSVTGYERFLRAFLDHLGVDTVRLVAHDWGVVGLTLGPRVQRLVAADIVPFLPGHRWHWVARIWRTPVAGEVLMGLTSGMTLRRVGGLHPEHVAAVLRYFDHGTQRAILKLYRSSSREALAALPGVRAPALVLWGERDRYLSASWATRLAEALGGEIETVPGAGHWPWLDRPEVVDRVAAFVRGD